MILIDAVNQALLKVGENTVQSVTANSKAMVAALAVKRAYEALCREAPWPWLQRRINVTTVNEEGTLPPEVLEVHSVFHGGNKLTYMTMTDFLTRENYESFPRFYSTYGNAIVTRPYENESVLTLYTKYLPIVDEKDSSFEIAVPSALEYLLVLRACVTLSVDHTQQLDKAQAYTAEYDRMLAQAKHELFNKEVSLLP